MVKWMSRTTSVAGRRGFESCSGREFFFHFRDVRQKPLVSDSHLSFLVSKGFLAQNQRYSENQTLFIFQLFHKS